MCSANWREGLLHKTAGGSGEQQSWVVACGREGNMTVNNCTSCTYVLSHACTYTHCGKVCCVGLLGWAMFMQTHKWENDHANIQQV